MDATVTNLGSTSPDDDVFLTTPKIEVKAGESVVIPDLTVGDLDDDRQLRQLVLDGKVSVSVANETVDNASATVGSLAPHALPKFTVANLPTGFVGRVAFATNGRTGAEGAGAGTGCPVVFSNGQWRRFEDMAVVAA